MPIISEQWAQTQIPVIYHFYDIGMGLRPSLIPALYRVEQSSLAEEKHVGIGGMDVAVWDDYENSGQIPETTFDKGYEKTFTHREYPVKLTMERKAFDDDQYGKLKDAARKLGISSMQKREVDAASVFVNAFSGSFLGADGVSLASASHPASPDKTGVLLSNTYTTALSAANIEAMRVDMITRVDDSNNIGSIMPDTLLVPPALEDTARKAVNSVLDPATANNTINPQNGRWNVIPWSYLTDTNAWFMIDSVMMRESLLWYNRVNSEITFQRLDSVRIQWEFYMRYSFGFTDWRWISASNPS